MEFKELVGKKVIEIRGDKDCLYFVTNEGTYRAEAEGDCCSVSWFEHLDNPEFIIGSEITGVEEVDADSVITDREHQENGYDSVQQYGYKFTTTKGNAILEMRNDSNGYYGGYVSFTKTNAIVVDKPQIKEGF